MGDQLDTHAILQRVKLLEKDLKVYRHCHIKNCRNVKIFCFCLFFFPKHFKEEASRLRENYNLEMEAWKERMIAEGREDLLETKKTKGRKQKSGAKRNRAKENNDWDEEEF